MSLTTGRAPHSFDPAGRFEPPVPSGVVYVEPFLRRVRAIVRGRTVIDSERVLLVHRPARPPTYAFPEGDVDRTLARSSEPAAAGYVSVAWDSVSAWYEEEEQVCGHPRNPYHRVDCVRARRRLRVELSTILLVDTDDVIGVYETSRAPQLYVRRQAVRMDRLIESPTSSYCPYKGTARYWSGVVGGTVVPDIAWSYEEPLPECGPIAGMLSFYPERTKVTQELLSWFPIPPQGTNTR